MICKNSPVGVGWPPRPKELLGFRGWADGVGRGDRFAAVLEKIRVKYFCDVF
jgi:hypothetical protein